MAIKVISLDIGGTIYKDKKEKGLIRKLSKKLNIINHKIEEAMKKTFQVSNNDIQQITQEFCKLINFNEPNYVKEIVLEHYKNENIEYTDQKIIDFILQYKSKGYKIALLSNSNILQAKNLDNALKNICDYILRSCDMKVTKQDQEFYKKAEKILNVKPSEIIHIGNSLISDYEVPKQCGWNCILFDCNNSDINVNTIEKLYSEVEKIIINNNFQV